MRPIAELPAWLEECSATGHRHFSIQPVTVTIGAESWPGVRYNTECQYQTGMDAVRWGKQKAGDPYCEEGIYCVGRLPKPYLGPKYRRGKYPQGRVCFPFEGLDWYVAGYMPQENFKPENEDSHPFGVNFILRPWNIPNSKVDEGEHKPYERIPMVVSGRFGKT